MFIFALIILYWFNVRPWLQRHSTFDMLLHIEHWSLWWVTVMMYGRFHQQLLNVIRHKLNLSFIIDDRQTSWFSYMYALSGRYSSETLWFPIVYPYMWCVHHSSLMISLYYVIIIVGLREHKNHNHMTAHVTVNRLCSGRFISLCTWSVLMYCR